MLGLYFPEATDNNPPLNLSRTESLTLEPRRRLWSHCSAQKPTRVTFMRGVCQLSLRTSEFRQASLHPAGNMSRTLLCPHVDELFVVDRGKGFSALVGEMLPVKSLFPNLPLHYFFFSDVFRRAIFRISSSVCLPHYLFQFMRFNLCNSLFILCLSLFSHLQPLSPPLTF